MRYSLGEACQNTFVLFDCMDKPIENANFFQEAHRCLVKEGRDDALILTDAKMVSGKLYVRMLVLGVDGTFGEFCGNGSRACAALLFKKHPEIKEIHLLTPYGTHPLVCHTDGDYSIQLPFPRKTINPKFIADEKRFEKKYPELSYVEMIEPHLAINGPMDDHALFLLGQELNHDKGLFPQGININAWHIVDQETLHVKTYERGVQRLTKSCGTGSISCASLYKSTGSLQVITPGGKLSIELKKDSIQLKGPATIPI